MIPIEKAIIKDLSVSRSTADALALRLKIAEPAARLILTRMEEAGKIESRPLGHLLVYQLKSR